jgi:nucleotide-binding universal stress UspA family protein
MTTPNRARRIVVGVDGSPGSRAALAWAVDEADRNGGEIDAVLAYDSGLAWIDVGSDYQARMLEQSARQAKATLHQALEWLGTEGPTSVPVHPLAVEGQPARVLIEFARDADLLVVGSRGHGGFTGVMLGSVSQRCAGHSPCPVVVVPSTAATTPEEQAR